MIYPSIPFQEGSIISSIERYARVSKTTLTLPRNVALGLLDYHRRMDNILAAKQNFDTTRDDYLDEHLFKFLSEDVGVRSRAAQWMYHWMEDNRTLPCNITQTCLLNQDGTATVEVSNNDNMWFDPEYLVFVLTPALISAKHMGSFRFVWTEHHTTELKNFGGSVTISCLGFVMQTFSFDASAEELALMRRVDDLKLMRSMVATNE